MSPMNTAISSTWYHLWFCGKIHVFWFYTRLWKENLNSDYHLFHQYQQNEQSFLILTDLTEHKKDHNIWR
jgi:hypothetical protein